MSRRKNDRFVVSAIYGLLALNALVGAGFLWHLDDLTRFHRTIAKMEEALERYRDKQ